MAKVCPQVPYPCRFRIIGASSAREKSVVHVLVVEDEPRLASLIRDQLVGAGYTVSLAGDGVLALRLLETRQADLIILDWMLPGLDGLEVCRRIRARSITPILMLTARGEELDRVLGLEIGAEGSRIATVWGIG